MKDMGCMYAYEQHTHILARNEPIRCPIALKTVRFSVKDSAKHFLVCLRMTRFANV